MSITLVLGATGKIGRILVERMAARGLPVRALVRDTSRHSFADDVDVVVGDLERGIEPALDGVSRVVFTAGSGAATGFDKTLLVDLWGATQAIDASAAAGVAHFIMVSSRGAGDPDRGPERIKPYLVAKHFADEHLLRASIPSTILRPGRLLDEPGTGLVRTDRPAETAEQVIPREDVAEAILACLARGPRGEEDVHELFSGSRPIAEVFGAES